MSISIDGKCGHRMKVPDALAGKQLLCDKCRAPLSVPGGPEAGKRVSGVEPGEGGSRLKRKTKRAKKKPAPAAATWPWIAGGVGVLLAVALGVAGLVWMLKRGETPQPAAQGPSEAAAKSEPAALPRNPAPGPGALAKAAPPAPGSAPAPQPKSLPLSEEDKRLQAQLKCELVLFGQARFEAEAFKGRPLTGVVVEIEGRVPNAVGRFEAATVTARSAAGANVPAVVMFTAAGRAGLADTAQVLPNSVAASGVVHIGAE